MKKIVLTLMFILGLYGNAIAGEKGVNIYEVPRALPKHEIIHNDLKHYSLTDFKDKFILVMFWSRNCSPCIKELESINNMAKQVESNGIKVVLISSSREWGSMEEQKKFLTKYGAPDIDFYTDENSRLAAKFGIFTSPHTVLINKKSEEIGRIRGAADWDDEKVIEYIYKLKAQHG